MGSTGMEMWRFEKKKGNRIWRDNFVSRGTCKDLSDIRKKNYAFLMTSTLEIDCSYLLFRQGIRPEWEDPANVDGGRWATYGVRHTVDQNIINRQWLNTVLSIMDNHFGGDAKHICGCQVDIRRLNYRISVWTSDKNDRDACLRIGAIAKDKISPTTRWKYEGHDSNDKQKSSCFVKPLYELNVQENSSENGNHANANRTIGVEP